MNDIERFVLVSNLPTRRKEDLLAIREMIDELLAERQRAEPRLMRSADEYFTKTAEARLEGEELMALKKEYLANGRMFKLTRAQADVIEGRTGRLASHEVTVYNVTWDATQHEVLEFSLQCNVPAHTRRRGPVSAHHISDAKAFFHKVKEHEIEAETTSAPIRHSKGAERAEKLKSIVDKWL